MSTEGEIRTVGQLLQDFKSTGRRTIIGRFIRNFVKSTIIRTENDPQDASGYFQVQNANTVGNPLTLQSGEGGSPVAVGHWVPMQGTLDELYDEIVPAGRVVLYTDIGLMRVGDGSTPGGRGLGNSVTLRANSPPTALVGQNGQNTSTVIDTVTIPANLFNRVGQVLRFDFNCRLRDTTQLCVITLGIGSSPFIQGETIETSGIGNVRVSGYFELVRLSSTDVRGHACRPFWIDDGGDPPWGAGFLICAADPITLASNQIPPDEEVELQLIARDSSQTSGTKLDQFNWSVRLIDSQLIS